MKTDEKDQQQPFKRMKHSEVMEMIRKSFGTKIRNPSQEEKQENLDNSENSIEITFIRRPKKE